MSKRILFLLVGLVLAGTVIFGQVTNARIIGTITDTAGSALPGVAVEATSPKLVGKATTISDEKGVFRLLNLMPGFYKIKFELDGFQTLMRDNIGVSLEQTITLNVTMDLGKITESIVVTGHAPLIDIKNTSKDLSMTKDTFRALPKGRDFASLVTVLPGVDTEAFAGGVINVVTRSGGNELHADVIGYYSSSALNGKQRSSLRINPLDNRIAEYVNYQDLNGKEKEVILEGGFNLGGYIIKDRLWFFGTFMPAQRDRTRPVTFVSDGSS